ncbi:MAG: DUF1294 domain-containing protein [Clostridiales bacterium]|nr:DUF1294 domain-containing protein [Clostridiales bacterium]
MTYLFWWCLALSLLDFLLMGADKRRAKKGLRRVPEKTFFLIALLGGTPGAVLGMYAFHHKTRHWYFKWGLPAILLLQAAALFRFLPAIR